MNAGDHTQDRTSDEMRFEDIMKITDEIKEMMDKGLYEEAIVKSVISLDHSNDRHRLLHLLGDSLFRKEMFIAASSFYKMAIDEGSERPWTYFNMARSLDKLEDPKSTEYFNKAISLSKNPEFIFGKAISKTTPNQEKKSLFYQAFNKDKSIIFRDWGIQERYPKKMRGDLFDIMSEGRNNSWFRTKSKSYNKDFLLFAKLVEKDYAQKVVNHLGIRTPKVYATGTLEEIFKRARPKRFVLKPKVGASMNGVIAVDNNFDCISRRTLEGSVEEFYESIKFPWKSRQFIMEEFVSDIQEKHNPYIKIPRDFKCFASRGEFLWVNVYNRNYPSSKEMTIACLDGNWRRLPNTSEVYRDSVNIEKPLFFDELKGCVEKLSASFPYFMRFDFFISENGPVFGEFTHNSSEGRFQTKFGERTQLQILYIHPDTENPIHDTKLLERAAST